jgi:hypothetical protein
MPTSPSRITGKPNLTSLLPTHIMRRGANSDRAGRGGGSFYLITFNDKDGHGIGQRHCDSET